MRPLKTTGYLAAVICLLILSSGALYRIDNGPIAVLSAIGLLFLSGVAGLLIWQRKQGADRLVTLWLTTAIIAGVQILGGTGSPGYPVYFLFLVWMVMPSINGPATETGCLIGMVEGLSILLGRSGFFQGGFPGEELIGNVLPGLGAFLAPALFAVAAEWLMEKDPELTRLTDRKDLQQRIPSLPDVIGFPVETARSMLPLIHRRSGAWSTCLFVSHDEHSFRLVDFLGGGGKIVDKTLIPASFDLFRKVRKASDGVMESIPGNPTGQESSLPYYLDPPDIRHVLAFPLRMEDRLQAVYVLDSREEIPFSPDVMEDLRDAAGTIAMAAHESGADPLAANPGGSWFSSLLVQAASAGELKQIIHIAIKHLHSLVEGATVTVAVLDDDGGSIRVFESLGRFSGKRIGRTVPLDSGVAGWVIKYRKQMKRNRMRLGDKAVRSLSEEDDPQREVGSCCAVPLMANNRILGVLLLEREEDEGFGRDHDYLLQGISGLLSLSVEKLLLEISEREKVSRDSLTGLPMTAEFNEVLMDTIKDVRRYGRSVSVLEVDLDKFNRFNSEHGFRRGDMVLRAAGRRLIALLGESVPVARIGNDSFGVCLAGSDRAAAEAVAEKIAASFSEDPLVIDDRPVIMTVCIGGCCSHIDRKIAQLPLEASRSLDRARQSGESRSHIVELGAFALE